MRAVFTMVGRAPVRFASVAFSTMVDRAPFFSGPSDRAVRDRPVSAFLRSIHLFALSRLGGGTVSMLFRMRTVVSNKNRMQTRPINSPAQAAPHFGRRATSEVFPCPCNSAGCGRLTPASPGRCRQCWRCLRVKHTVGTVWLQSMVATLGIVTPSNPRHRKTQCRKIFIEI